jgi:surface polysaccharide O-acyltransferase-like enzyme
MQRLAFVQWLRVFLSVLVVAHHAGQPYGPTGGAWPVHDPVAQAAWLGPFFGVNAAFFMGFFFLLAGYFTPASYDRKGDAIFVRDRLTRLGIPLAVVDFIVFPILIYLWTPQNGSFASFYFGDYIGHWHVEMGHLWFVAHLLVYSLLYALWRKVRGERHGRPLPPPNDRTVALYTLALAVADVLIRMPFPQDRWVRILWILPTEPAHLPQYASLFVIGIIAAHGRWLETVSVDLGARWFAIGAVAFGLAGLAIGRGLPVQIVWGFAEAFVCVGMILGLTVLFRRLFVRGGPVLSALEGNVYGVYIFHWFIVVGIQTATLGLAATASEKFLLVTILAVAASFVVTALARRIPGVNRVL